jgi:putative tricarboxylic transport membrane protein
MGNWRGIVGAPGMSAAAQQAWVERMEKLSASAEWKAELAKSGLEASVVGGAAFGAFMADENARIKPILTELGLVK